MTKYCRNRKGARAVLAAVCAFAVFFLSCATTPQKQPAKFTERPERRFWQMQRQPDGGFSTVYVLGTIHMADERIYPFAQTVLDAFDSADRIVGEISTEGWSRFEPELMKMMLNSISLDKDVSDLRQRLSPEEIQILEMLFEPEVLDSLCFFEPWVLNTSLSGLAVSQYTSLSAQMGPDVQLIIRAGSEDREMEGLDELETQLALLDFGTYEQQLEILRSSIASFSDPSADLSLLEGMYSAYEADDRKLVGEFSEESNRQAVEEMPFYAEYVKMLYDDRNSDWADKMDAYLDIPGTTFVFAGAGHFTGDNSVFDIMEERGYIFREESEAE